MANDREKLRELEEQSLYSARQMLGFQKEIVNILMKRNLLEEESILSKEKGRNLTKEEKKEVANVAAEHQKYVDQLQKQIKWQKESIINWKRIGGILREYVLGYLMPADKVIKSISLEMGFTAERSDQLRTSIEQSAIHGARLGLSVEDMTQMYTGYVAQVGRAVTMSEEQMKAMANIAKGTQLGADGAAELAGHFALMGREAVSAAEQVQGILETSERMGVNATSVLKAVSANFKSLQTYTFRSGVQGMGNMAAYAEKFKVDIDSALSSAEKARRLDGAIELAAELQVLGGEFAKSDPFEMLFLSRNDPEGYQKKIAELTKGMVTLNKVGGEFEYQLASPMARDMLEQAGKALGFTLDEMTEISREQSRMSDMTQQMFGGGYSKEQREVIQGMAQMDKKTTEYYVMIKGVKRDISNLSNEELETLEKQKVSLKERAKNAQTFDQQWGIFMDELKAVGLPLLRTINTFLDAVIRPAMDKLTEIMEGFNDGTSEWKGNLIKGVAVLGTGYLAFKGISLLVSGIVGKVGGLLSKIGGGKKLADLAGGGTTQGTFGGGAGAGLKGLGKGAGVGLAGLGIGVGIGEAAKGIGELAKSLNMLNKDQLETLKGITTTLAWFMGAVAGIGVIASIAGAAALPLIAFGGAVTLIGVGIGAAAWGIGEMSKGMGELFAVANGDDVLKFSLGLSALAVASTALANPMAIAGIAALSGGMYIMSMAGKNIEGLSDSLGNTATQLKGSIEEFREVRDIINAISNADLSNLNSLSTLKDLFNKPLKVEFDEKEVALVSNITLNIDGNRFIEEFNLVERVVIGVKERSGGFQSSGN